MDRLAPILLTPQDLDDLSTFTGMDPQDCLDRVRNYSIAEHATRWKAARPETPEQILAFYRSTDLYVWELMQWHASDVRAEYRRALVTFVDGHPPNHGWRRVCDFGCGIGTDALFFAERGYDVTLVDVDGPSLQFARHRFQRRGLAGEFVSSKSMLPQLQREAFDCIVCFDVFEHLPDPLLAARRLVSALRHGGTLIHQASFGDAGCHPCHLAAGIHRYGGLRWHAHLGGLGLSNAGPMASRKAGGLELLIQRLRFALWRASGLWVIRLPS